MRLFIAINFDENMTDALIEMQDDLHLTRGALATRAGDITPGMVTPGII